METIVELAADAGLLELFFVKIVLPPRALESRSPGFTENVRVYNQILTQVSGGKHVQVIDFNQLVDEEARLVVLLDDGIHIGPEGHEMLARELGTRIVKVFEEMNEQLRRE